MLSQIILDASTVVNGASGSGSGASGGGMNPLFMIILYVIVIFAVIYFFSVKPQRKKEREMQELRNAVKVGDSVL